MDQALISAVDGYIEALFKLRDHDLEHTLAASEKAGLPEIQISPAQGKLLTILAKLIGARRILEIGTLGGYSAICLARGLAEGGELVTLESEEAHAKVARESLERAGFSGQSHIVLGPALQTLPDVEARGPFDMIFIDADKDNYPGYLDWALKLTRPGGLIVADNIVREGEVVDPQSEDPLVIGVRKFNEQLAADPRAEGIVMQVVGSKGHDGLAIIRRT